MTNEVPSGWREVSEKEFAQSSAFVYSPTSTEYRQFRPEGEPTMIAARLNFMHDGTGWALVNDYWAGRVRFFKFGCAHQYHEISQDECRERGLYHAGACYHVSVCGQCGHVNAVDSSG